MDSEALAELLEDLAKEAQAGMAVTVTEDGVPDPPDQAITKQGDLIILGNHRLLCGDSSKPGDRLLGGQPIHLINTDPPYNVKVEPRSAGPYIDNVAVYEADEPVEGAGDGVFLVPGLSGTGTIGSTGSGDVAFQVSGLAGGEVPYSGVGTGLAGLAKCRIRAAAASRSVCRRRLAVGRSAAQALASRRSGSRRCPCSASRSATCCGELPLSTTGCKISQLLAED